MFAKFCTQFLAEIVEFYTRINFVLIVDAERTGAKTKNILKRIKTPSSLKFVSSNYLNVIQAWIAQLVVHRLCTGEVPGWNLGSYI